MFCHKCGTQISEGAAFCHNCGTEVVYDTTDTDSQRVDTLALDGKNDQQQTETISMELETSANQLSVMLAKVTPAYKIRVIKLVREYTGLGLADSKVLVEKVLVEKVSVLLKATVAPAEAESVKETFIKAGAIVTFTDQNGDCVNITACCEKCGAALDDNRDTCPSCGCPICVPTGPKARKSLGIGFDLDELWSKIKELPLIGKILILLGIGLCALILVVILRIVFSTAISVLVTIAIGYFVYQTWCADYIVEYIYARKGCDLQLPNGMNAQSLIEALSGKFNYPYFKGARYSAEGECLIEGRYAVYPVKFVDENNVELEYQIGNKEEKHRTILREAIAVRSYINKFFNPTLPFDAVKDLNALKREEGLRKATKFVEFISTALIVIIIAMEYIVPGGFQQIMQPGAQVRNAYLTKYSDEVTVEEAFDNFFANGKWSTYKAEGYSYVVFTGMCEYDGEAADVRITFKITGEHFRLDSLDINGEEQNDLVLGLLIAKVYSDY